MSLFTKFTGHLRISSDRICRTAFFQKIEGCDEMKKLGHGHQNKKCRGATIHLNFALILFLEEMMMVEMIVT